MLIHLHVDVFRQLLCWSNQVPDQKGASGVGSRGHSRRAGVGAPPQSQPLNTKYETRNLKPETRNPKPETPTPKPETRNRKPETPNLKPRALNLRPVSRWEPYDGVPLRERGFALSPEPSILNTQP